MKDSLSVNNENNTSEKDYKIVTNREYVNQLELISKKLENNPKIFRNFDEENFIDSQNANTLTTQKNGVVKEIPDDKFTPMIIINQNSNNKKDGKIENEELNNTKKINFTSKNNNFSSKKKIKYFPETNNKNNYQTKGELINMAIKEKTPSLENMSKKIKISYSHLTEKFDDVYDISWQIGSNCRFPDKLIKTFLGNKTKEKLSDFIFGENPLECLKDIQNNITDPPPAKNKIYSKNIKPTHKQNKDQNIFLQKYIKNLPVFYPPNEHFFQKVNYFNLNKIDKDKNIMTDNFDSNKNINSIEINEEKMNGINNIKKNNSNNISNIEKAVNGKKMRKKKVNKKEKLTSEKKINDSVIFDVNIPNIIEIDKRKLGNIYVCNQCDASFYTHQGLGGHISKNHGDKKKNIEKKRPKKKIQNSVLYIFDSAKKILYNKYILKNDSIEDKKKKSYNEYILTEEGKNEVNNLIVKYSEEFNQLLSDLESGEKNSEYSS